MVPSEDQRVKFLDKIEDDANQDKKQDDGKNSDTFLLKLCLMNARLQLMLRSTNEERK